MQVHLCRTTTGTVIQLFRVMPLQYYIFLSLENTLIEDETVSCEVPPKASNEGLRCGPHCANVTNLDLVEAKRSSWSVTLHQDQEKVVIPFFKY